MPVLKNCGGWAVGLHTVQMPPGAPELRVSVILDRGNGEGPVVITLSQAAAQIMADAMIRLIREIPPSAPEGESS